MSKSTTVAAGMKTILSVMIATVLAASPVASQAASGSKALTIKGGVFRLHDTDQETASRRVIYEDEAPFYGLAMEHRARAIAIGVEYFTMAMDWDEDAAVPTRPYGRVRAHAIGATFRKYFRPWGNFSPYIGAGIGLGAMVSRFRKDDTGTPEIERDRSGAYMVQAMLGGEFRWEGVGLMIDIKQINLGRDDDDGVSVPGEYEDYPHFRGPVASIGLSFLF